MLWRNFWSSLWLAGPKARPPDWRPRHELVWLDATTHCQAAWQRVKNLYHFAHFFGFDGTLERYLS